MIDLKHVNWGMFLASLQTVLSFAASLGYAFAGDWKRVFYWLCAGALTATVTWWFR